VTVSAAASTVNLYGFSVPGQTLNPAAPCAIPPNQSFYETATLGGPWEPSPSGTSFSYWQVAPVAIVNGAWPDFGSGTGSVTFTVDGVPQATVALNSFGYAGWVPPSTFNAGTHTIGASYSGDASYAAATAAPYTAIVPQVTPAFSATPAANCSTFWSTGTATAVSCPFSAGNTLRVEVQISQANCHVPTGAITVNVGSLSQNVTLIPGGLTTISLDFVGTPVLSGEAVFPNLPAGTYPVSATYAGDINSLPTTSAAPNPRIGPPPAYAVVATGPAQQLPTTTTMSVQPPSFDDTLWLDFGVMATVTGPTGSTTPPTGSVVFFEDGLPIAFGTLTPAGPNSSTVAATAEGTSMDVGSTPLRAVYSGDSVYQSSAFVENYQFTINTTAPDFLLAPQTPQLTVQAGSSGTAGFNLASIGAYSGTVSLTCASSSSLVTCSLNPASVAVNGPATTTLTVKVAAQSAALARPQRSQGARWPMIAGALVFGLIVIRRVRKDSLWRSMLLCAVLVGSMGAVSCGSINSSGGSSSTPPPTPAATAYSVVVTATANGIVHNAVITVVVP
jgi:hypothetical protein